MIARIAAYRACRDPAGLDLHMLVLLGARERTAAEYGALFRAAGFELARVVPTPAGPGIVEAVPL